MTVPFADVSIRADAVWMRRGPDQNCRCSAEIAIVNDALARPGGRDFPIETRG
jgi:hypothetical protein